jgi:GNAT superfamily N-acetyltransferase
MTRIRLMAAGDASSVADLTNQLGYSATGDDIARRFDDIRRAPEAAVLVATDERDSAIGWILVRMVAALSSDRPAEIGGLVVGDGHRSEGIGTELVAAAEEWSRQHGARSLTVRSRSTRERAHRFYVRLGYEQIKISHVFEKPIV